MDFRLKVFYTVAKRLSFTKAAAELYISQPAVTRHIHKLETQFKVKLFEREGNKIHLTAAGKTLLKHTKLIFDLYRDLEFEMNSFSGNHSGVLRIGASSTIAQYVLPGILAQFNQKFTNIKVHLISGNTEQIEQALLNKEIELGIIEGKSRNKEISYSLFLEDEIVLVEKNGNTLIDKNFIEVAELKKYPILIRESGSGTREVIDHALKEQQIKISDLQIEMQLGATESIKSYLLDYPCWSFISIYAILKELNDKKLRIIDIEGLKITRPFCFIQMQGRIDPLSKSFMQFAQRFEELLYQAK